MHFVPLSFFRHFFHVSMQVTLSTWTQAKLILVPFLFHFSCCSVLNCHFWLAKEKSRSEVNWTFISYNLDRVGQNPATFEYSICLNFLRQLIADHIYYFFFSWMTSIQCGNTKCLQVHLVWCYVNIMCWWLNVCLGFASLFNMDDSVWNLK